MKRITGANAPIFHHLSPIRYSLSVRNKEPFGAVTPLVSTVISQTAIPPKYYSITYIAFKIAVSVLSYVMKTLSP